MQFEFCCCSNLFQLFVVSVFQKRTKAYCLKDCNDKCLHHSKSLDEKKTKFVSGGHKCQTVRSLTAEKNKALGPK